MLTDGVYDVIIVDADENEDDDDVTTLDLTITTGSEKGRVVAVRARGLRRDAVALLGLPATLVVERGKPRVVLD